MTSVVGTVICSSRGASSDVEPTCVLLSHKLSNAEGFGQVNLCYQSHEGTDDNCKDRSVPLHSAHSACMPTVR
jgi:hypothetical protein